MSMQNQIDKTALADTFSERIVTAKQVAAKLGYSHHWLYRRIKEDPPPRCRTHTLKFDSWYVPFQVWFNRQLGHDAEPPEPPATLDNQADHA